MLCCFLGVAIGLAIYTVLYGIALMVTYPLFATFTALVAITVSGCVGLLLWKSPSINDAVGGSIYGLHRAAKKAGICPLVEFVDEE